MKNKLPKHTLPALFVLGGMLAGYLSYRLAGCTSGTCLITATPLRSMLYMGFVGWLLSGVFSGSCAGCQAQACRREADPSQRTDRR